METRKIIGTIVGILGFIAVMAGLSYALISYGATDNSSITGNRCFDISYTKGEDVTGEIERRDSTDTDTSNILSTTITFNTNGCDSINIGTLYIHVNTANGLTSSGNLNYTISSSDTSFTEIEGTVNVSEDNGEIEINLGKLNNTSTTYTLSMWASHNDTDTNDYTFDGYVYATARQQSTYE